MKPHSIELQEIANWQLDPAGPDSLQVDLPKLQRGFVWDPARIINLWDSVLRQFPIGSLLLSEIGEKDATERRGDKYWLLDGQQRATTIAMGFYNPWETHAHLADADRKQGWSLRVMPVLWMDFGADQSEEDENLFSPYLVTQSHPWGYSRFGWVLSTRDRREAMNAFFSTTGHYRYTSFRLKDVFPFNAKIPVPMAFVIASARKCLGDDDAEFKGLLTDQCQHLPTCWQSRFKSQLAGLSQTTFRGFREAGRSLMEYSVHLNYLNLRTKDSITQNDDNSVLFVRLNTGGKSLTGEELIFSLFKSAFPAAKDAVENAAVGFMPPSRLFSLIVRLVAADGDPSKLHQHISLRVFKAKITDNAFKERLEEFIENRVAVVIRNAQEVLTSRDYCLPMALATRTINQAPDVFLALLYWLNCGETIPLGSTQHRSLLGAFTAVAWFAPGEENLRQWMEAAHSRPLGQFWSSETIRTLFTRREYPIPSLPDPILLQGFLDEAIVNGSSDSWQTLVAASPMHPIFSKYSHIPVPDEVPPEAESGTTKESLREKAVRENLCNFLDTLRHNTHFLLFAQRDYIRREFNDFQQWDIVLQDTNCPWDWDHIYPSAHRRWHVDTRYKEWHNTIGNKRVEELSKNRANGASLPKDKLADSETRKDSFICDELWEMIQGVQTAITDPVTAKTLCRIILRRMALLYGEWYTTLEIGQLMA